MSILDRGEDALHQGAILPRRRLQLFAPELQPFPRNVVPEGDADTLELARQQIKAPLLPVARDGITEARYLRVLLRAVERFVAEAAQLLNPEEPVASK